MFERDREVRNPLVSLLLAGSPSQSDGSLSHLIAKSMTKIYTKLVTDRHLWFVHLLAVTRCVCWAKIICAHSGNFPLRMERLSYIVDSIATGDLATLDIPGAAPEGFTFEDFGVQCTRTYGLC